MSGGRAPASLGGCGLSRPSTTRTRPSAEPLETEEEEEEEVGCERRGPVIPREIAGCVTVRKGRRPSTFIVCKRKRKEKKEEEKTLVPNRSVGRGLLRLGALFLRGCELEWLLCAFSAEIPPILRAAGPALRVVRWVDGALVDSFFRLSCGGVRI